MITVDSMLVPFSRSEALSFLIDYLQTGGFDTDTWQDGEIEKTLLILQAVQVADMSDVVALHAAWSFNETATGEALNLYSRNRYDQEKEPARQTIGLVTFTSTATVPYAKDPGGIVVSTADGVELELYGDDTTPGNSIVIPAGGTVDALVIARKAGASGNVATAAISSLITPLAGVTVSNTGSPWYTTSGRDEESDASMQRRNTTKWATQTVELIALSYEAIARAAGASKVYVDDQNPRGAGTIDVLVAGETALLSDPEATAIQEAFAVRAFQTPAEWPVPVTSPPARVSVEHPDTLELDVTATVYHDPNVPSAVMTERLRDALVDFLRRTPVGGWRYLPDNDHVILPDDVADALRSVAGVRTVIMTEPAATIAVDVAELVIEGTWSVTPVAQQ